jgi:hypothetical protein
MMKHEKKHHGARRLGAGQFCWTKPGGAARQAQTLDKIYQLDQNINTHDATDRLLFNMLGALAQFETEIRAKR